MCSRHAIHRSTFSASAKSCFWQHYNNGEAASEAGAACADGTSVTVFDNNGVGTTAAAAQSSDWNVLHSVPEIVPGVTFELGRYLSQSNWIYGYVCRPSDAQKHKAVIINHGGFGPIGNIELWGFCVPAAQNGWYAAMSAYRGEQATYNNGLYQSGGAIELCQGEVTDVLRLTDIVRVRPEVDNTRILMWGHSHGGGITERAVQRGALVKAAASFSAPTDMYSWYDYCGPGSDCDTAVPGTRAALALTFGIPSQNFSVTPYQNRIPYDWRSPVSYKADLAARTDVKFRAIQGAADPLIHPSQACSLAQGSTSANWHFQEPGNPPDLTPTTTTTAPVGCDTYGLTWTAGDPPYGSWPGNRYLLVYDAEDHGTVLDPTRAPWVTFVNWVNTIFP